MNHRLAPILIIALLWQSAAHAADDPARAASTPSFISELRLGILAHDPLSPESGTADFHGQVLFARPTFAAGIPALAVPRPHLGGALNSSDKTSHLHAGLTWTFDITKTVFVEIGLGGALHSGKTANIAPAGRNALGCPAHFRESLGVGYRIDANWSLIGTLEHLSNAGLCKHNRGLTNIGVSLGYQF